MAATEKCNFDTVELGINSPTPCSPDFDFLDRTSIGIRINMPTAVKVDADPETNLMSQKSRLPLCLVMQVPQSDVLSIDLMQDHVSVVVVNVATGQSISGNLMSPRMRAPKRERPVSPMSSDDKKAFDEEVKRRVARHYINVNLIEHLPFPAITAKYKVYALFKTHKSNVVTIELK